MATIHRLERTAQIPPIPQPNRDAISHQLAVIQIHLTDMINLTDRLVTRLDSPNKEAASLMSYVLNILQWKLNLDQARLHFLHPLENCVAFHEPGN